MKFRASWFQWCFSSYLLSTCTWHTHWHGRLFWITWNLSQYMSWFAIWIRWHGSVAVWILKNVLQVGIYWELITFASQRFDHIDQVINSLLSIRIISKWVVNGRCRFGCRLRLLSIHLTRITCHTSLLKHSSFLVRLLTIVVLISFFIYWGHFSNISTSLTLVKTAHQF